jgi:aconitate decarboxylase
MLREQHQIKPEQIAKVDVVFPRFEYVNRPQPQTGLDGKFSVQYTTAVALLDGEITVDSFDNERRFAPDVATLLPKIKLIFDDAIPNDFDLMHIDMTVTLTDGRVLQQRVDKLSGWIGSPLTREQRMKKFHSCARRVLALDQAERIVALAEGLEQLQDVNALMTLVRG